MVGEKFGDSDYNEEKARMLKRRRGFEWLLALLVLGALAALLVCQFWLYVDRSRAAATWYGMEYDEAVVPAAASNSGLYGSITLELAEYSRLEHAYVLINGVKAGDFSEPELTLRVFDGDVLEVDASAYNVPVRIRLQKASYGIDRERLFSEVQVCGERKEIGCVIFK
jgi:hypothetical protein